MCVPLNTDLGVTLLDYNMCMQPILGNDDKRFPQVALTALLQQGMMVDGSMWSPLVLGVS